MSEPTKMGRPTKYKEEYVEEMYNFFKRDAWTTKKVNKMVKGQMKEVTIQEPCMFPTFEKFSLNIDVCMDTLREWRDVYPDFSATYKKCKAIQKDILVQNGLFGNYEKAFTIFCAKNVTDMRNDPEPESTGQEDLEFIE